MASLPPGAVESLARAGVTPREREVLVLLIGRLTNREIADRLHCSVRTVESHVSALLGKLGVADRISLAQLGPSLLGANVGASRRLPRPMTSFVGRRRELAEIDELLASTPLVTLIGAPGIGKTRIAVELATRRLAADAGSGAASGLEIAFCDLTPIAEDALVAEVVLAALGGSPPQDRSPTDALSEIVAGRRVLLVLDNCEHVAAGAADAVRAAVGAAPDLRVLATSREPLGVDGELTYLVHTLGAAGATSPASDRSTGPEDDAIRLFTDRARAARPDFRPETADLAAIAEICRRLDGLPLAIELTAPLLRAYSPAQLESALEEVALLTPVGRTVRSHHDTLRSSLEWSHRLLVPDERRLFARLSVFAGSVGLAAIEAICSDAPLARRDVFGLLASLVDRSLVEADTTPSTGSRFRLLFPIRAFAREQAAASGELEGLERRHAEFFAERAEEAEPNLLGPDALDWVSRLRRRHRRHPRRPGLVVRVGGAGVRTPHHRRPRPVLGGLRPAPGMDRPRRRARVRSGGYFNPGAGAGPGRCRQPARGMGPASSRRPSPKRPSILRRAWVTRRRSPEPESHLARCWVACASGRLNHASCSSAHTTGSWRQATGMGQRMHCSASA